MKSHEKSTLRREKEKQQTAFLGGFSLVAAQKLRQYYEQAKNMNSKNKNGHLSTPYCG